MASRWAKRDPQLHTQARRRAIAEVRRLHPYCAGCDLLIDMTLDHQRHPLGSTVDENLPRSKGGSATDPANLLHMHRSCNSIKGDSLLTADVRARCRAVRHTATVVASRDW